MKKLLLFLAFTAFNSFVFAQKTIKMLQSPAENQFSTIHTEGYKKSHPDASDWLLNNLNKKMFTQNSSFLNKG